MTRWYGTRATAALFALLSCVPALAQFEDFDETAEGPWSDIDNTTLVVPMVPDGTVTLDGTVVPVSMADSPAWKSIQM